MLDSPILQVIIGLIFIYSLFSVIVTQLNTSIANLIGLRANSLKAGIQGLLTDPEMRAKFLAHPLIRLIPIVIQPDTRISAQTAEEIGAQRATKVGWIKPELFSDTLLDILAVYANDRLFREMYDVVDKTLAGADRAQLTESIRRFQNGGIGVADLQSAISAISNSADREAVSVHFARISAMQRDLTANNEQSRLIPVLAGLQEVSEPGMKKALETLMLSAQSIDEARMKLETWFNSQMEQVSDYYRRNMTRISYIVGLVLVLTLNVDTLQIARTLWLDPAVRDAVSTAAQVAVSSGALEQQVRAAQQAQQDATGALADPAAQAAVDAAQTQNEQAIDAIDQLLSLRLPIGWEFVPVEGGCPPQGTVIIDPCSNGRNLWLAGPANNPDFLGFIVSKIAGWALTVIAIAQGAPFWFDLLNRIARRPSS
jgi:hypothetical protein